MRIVFATNNAHKLSEIRQILGHRIEVLSLSDIGCHADIPETADTLEGNWRWTRWAALPASSRHDMPARDTTARRI